MKTNYLLFFGAFLFITLQANAQYCVPSLGDPCNPEQINNVTFAGINNTTQCNSNGGYNDFTAIVGTVDAGDSYELSVTVVADVGFPQSQLFAFIDWNQDEVWDISDERYTLSAQPMVSDTYTLFIDVPGDALEGATRMRIAMVYGTGAFENWDGCTNYTYGEIEDYTIDVSALSIADNNIDGFDYLYSSQSKQLTLTANEAFSNISLYNLLGQEVIAKNLSNNNEVVDLSGITNGVYIGSVNVNGKMATFKVVKR